MMRLSFFGPSVAACLSLVLAACSSYPPRAGLSGHSESQVVAAMGQPETRRPMDGGTSRLEYPGGPFGRQTWFVYLDAAGRVMRSEQVLTEAGFNQIIPGMGVDEVRRRLGRPGEVRGLARGRGEVWSYRFESPFCQWFQVELSQEKTVRSAGYGEPPECDRPNEIIIPW